MRAAIVALLLASVASASEPVDLRLLRTIQTGTLQGLEVAEIRRHAKGLETDFVGHALARAALVVLGEDAGFPEWPLERLLDRTLDLLQRGGSSAFPSRSDLPAEFGGEDLTFTLVYALVASGQEERATLALERQLGSESEYVRGLVLQSLRNIGGDRTSRLIQKSAEQGKDRNLPENLLADLRYPFLLDLQKRLPLLPPERRGRRDLLAAAQERCGERQALAVYFLGFLADAEDPQQNGAELDLLRSLTRSPCFHTRYFAIRALALRSAESIGFWTGLLRGEEDGWQRAQVARIAFARFGREFSTTALGLLAEEAVQYVQWELMHGCLETREGARFRDYWDIWQPTTLVFRLYFPEGGGREVAEAELDEILSWLETGARPRHPWVLNHLLYRLAGKVSGRHTVRYLRIVDRLPEKAEQWWSLSGLSDAGALPLLRYWLAASAQGPQRDQLEKLIVRLETPRADTAIASTQTCCRPTGECLLSWIRAFPAGHAAHPISSAEEARAWLDQDAATAPEPRIRFTDSLGRRAVVTLGLGREERWEHLYGCWWPSEPRDEAGSRRP